MKKHLTVSLFVVLFFVIGLVGVKVFAEPSEVAISPMVLNINPSGDVLIRGFVESVNTDSFVVKSWGGNWTVKIVSSTKMVTLNKVISDLQPSDFVGVSGNITTDGSFVIDASIVREWAKRIDHDKDGISDDQDKDDDNDGISDSSDAIQYDHDNDSISDDLDTDDDNDGIDDSKDSKLYDHDNDGHLDSQDDDHDNDGVEDSEDLKPEDHDNDSISDDQDKDDDNDSIDDSKDSKPYDHDNDGKDDEDDENDDN